MRRGLRVIVLIRENLKVEQLAGLIELRRQAATHNSSPQAHAIHEGTSEEESLRRRHLEISVTPTSEGKSEIDLIGLVRQMEADYVTNATLYSIICHLYVSRLSDKSLRTREGVKIMV